MSIDQPLSLTLAARTAAIVRLASAGLALDDEMLRMVERAEEGRGATPEEVSALALAWAVWVRDGEHEARAQNDVRRGLLARAGDVLALNGLEGV